MGGKRADYDGTFTAARITRFEVIDDNGRVLVCRPCMGVHLSFQDANHTLKVFVSGTSILRSPEEKR